MAQSGKLKELAQLRPTTTSNEVLFTPVVGKQYILTMLVVANVTNTTAKYRLFIDKDGTTADQTTALLYDINLLKESADIYEWRIPLSSAAGRVTVRSDKASGLTFTLYGEELNQ